MNTVIHVKSKKEIKENAQELARSMGLSLSDVINASLRNFIRTRELIFSDTLRMTPELEKLLDKVEKDIKNKKKIFPNHFLTLRKWILILILYDHISPQKFH